MNVKKIITLLLALLLAACHWSPAAQRARTTRTARMAKKPGKRRMYKQLMAQENAILSENTALWEKVFMAADKGMTMQEDGSNYGDFLLKTIEIRQGSVYRGGAEAAHRRGEQDQGYREPAGRAGDEVSRWRSQTPDSDDNTSVPAGSDMTTPPDDGSMQKFPAFEGKDLDGNTVKSERAVLQKRRHRGEFLVYHLQSLRG